jgi:hypothetical protein
MDYFNLPWIRRFIPRNYNTFLLEYAAANIAGLDLSVAAQDQMFLLGVFEISNYLTGIMFILIGLKARNLVPPVLIVIPIIYLIGYRIVRLTAQPESAFEGGPFMMNYFLVCIITFIAIIVHLGYTRRKQVKL